MRGRFVVVHRWLGIGMCIPLLMWFLSGIGMMYIGFPAVTAADRLARMPAIAASTLRVLPAEAFAALDGPAAPAEITLETFAGRPVYRFHIGDRRETVYADTDEVLHTVADADVATVASAWSGVPAVRASLDTRSEIDQWTVESPLRADGPLWKFSFPDGQQVYVSRKTGTVRQYTTPTSRALAYLGPIPHWVYFTPLRRHRRVWKAAIISIAAFATTTACVGLALGLTLYFPSRRTRSRGLSLPYRGLKRWHVRTGLIVGAAAVTWSFSGLLSMDPLSGTADESGPGNPHETRFATLLRDPIDLRAFSRWPPVDALAPLGEGMVKTLELMSVNGAPEYLATLRDGVTRLVPDAALPRHLDRITEAARRAGTDDIRRLDHYDTYYRDRRAALPLPVVVVQFHDAGRSRIYVDPKAMRVVGTYRVGDWTSRWLYHGLHSLDFPWLYLHRPLWDVVVVAFMLGGAALSATGVVLGWRVLAGSVRPFRA